MALKGKQFEKAVYDFLKAISPDSQIFFDYKVPDKDTGVLRQVDAWIKTNYGGHIPLSILISCKDYKRKLNISHIETFISEIQSTCANTGIIYSSSGFSNNALKKAEVHGINCCQLFTGKPTPLPARVIYHSYVCKPRIAIEISNDYKDLLNNKGIIYWNEIFNMNIEDNVTVLEALERSYLELEKEALATKNLKNSLPQCWTSGLQFLETKDNKKTYKITIDVKWAIFKGKTEYHLYKGSYCFNDGAYLGNMRTPAIDTHEFHPGIDFWEEIKDIADLPNPNMVLVFKSPDVKTTLIEGLGNKKF